MEKEKKDPLKKHIEKLTTPTFEKAAKERKPSSMTTIKPIYKIFFRPNNWRLKQQIKTRDNSTMYKLAKAIGSAIKKKDFTYNEHTKLVFIKNYNGITIQLGKNTTTAIYSQKIIKGNKQIYFIRAYSTEHLEERIDQLKDDIKKKMVDALRIFCKAYNIETIGNAAWDRYEDFIKGEEFIDKIPVSTIIHDTYFKKVYGQGIEFKQTDKKEEPTVHLKNYIVNQAIKRHSPEIAESIEILGNALLNNLNPSIVTLAKELELHRKVELSELATNKERLKTDKVMQNTLKDISHTLKEKPPQKQPQTSRRTHYKHKSLKTITFCGRENHNLKTTKDKDNVDCKICIKKLKEFF